MRKIEQKDKVDDGSSLSIPMRPSAAVGETDDGPIIFRHCYAIANPINNAHISTGLAAAASLRFMHCMHAGGPKKNMGRMSLTAAAVASADDGGGGKLKSSWPEMVGKHMLEAMPIIMSAPDFDDHRVYLFLDENLIVVRTPVVG
jgi:hypothetical protein